MRYGARVCWGVLVAAGVSCVAEQHDRAVLFHSHGVVTEFAKWVADDTATGDSFGRDVAVHGNTAIFGSPYAEDAAGKVHVFARRGATWSQRALLGPALSSPYDRFGTVVDIHHKTAVVAAIGAGHGSGSQGGVVHVFMRDGAAWTEQAALHPPPGSDSYFGASVAVYGNTLLVGATGDDQWAGAVYAYTRSGASWSQQARLSLSDARAGDLFGASIAFQGNTALVAAPGRGGEFRGAAYIFTRAGSEWSQQAELLPPDAAPYKWFGMPAVSLDGHTALIGCYEDDEHRANGGAAYVYTREGTTWSFQDKLMPADPISYGRFGWSVDLDGDAAVIGAPNARGRHLDTGAAYVFTRTGATWTEAGKLVAKDGAEFDRFGWDVAMDSGMVLVSAESASAAGPYSGAVYGFYPPGACPASGVGGWEYCTPQCPCGEGQGDCDGDGDCAPGFVCLHDRGGLYGYQDPEMDVCAPPGCLPDSGAGTWSFCTEACPCGQGQGDCDSHSDCAPGLRCLSDVGPSYGYPDAEMDVCSSLCPTIGQGSSRFCSVACPCDQGEGDCDSDSQCAPGLVCSRNVGACYGFEAKVDVCEDTSATSPPGMRR